MANYATLKSAIQQVVKTNGNNEITGALLQQSLLAMIDSLGSGYQYVGVATPAMNPGTPDHNVFYIAGQSGQYPNFGGFNLLSGDLAVMKYNGTWAYDILHYVGTLGNWFTIMGRVVGASGNIDPSTTERRCTDYIPVRAGDVLYIKGYSTSSVALCAFYDENKTFISSIYGAEYSRIGVSVTVPQDAKYMRCTGYNDGSDYIEGVFVGIMDYVFTTYVTHSELNNAFITALYDAANWFKNENKYVRANNGVITDTTNEIAITDYIDVSGRTSIKVRGRSSSTIALCVFYDENKTFISSISGASYNNILTEISVPENAKYVIATGYMDGTSQFVLFSLSDIYTMLLSVDAGIKDKYFDSEKWFSIPGKYINHSGVETTTATAGVASTNFIDITNIKGFEITGGRYGSSVALYAFYNENRGFISGYWASGSAKVDASDFPAGAKYIRFTGYNDGRAKLYIYTLFDVLEYLEREIAGIAVGGTGTAIGNISGVGTMGASLMFPGNDWVQWGCEIVNTTPYNKAESGVGIPAYFANKIWRGTYCTDAEFENMDILAIQFASSGDVFNSPDGFKATIDDYTQGFDPSSADNPFTVYNDAQILDYILKWWQTKCYAQRLNSASKWYNTQYGKPCRLMFVTHWHDGRVEYNTAIRQVAEKWGGGLCEFDKKIGFSKNQTMPDGSQVSRLFAIDTQTIDGVVFGWHPLRGDAGHYIQTKMANIFADSLNEYMRQIVV